MTYVILDTCIVMGLKALSIKTWFVALCGATLVPILVHSVIWDYDCLPTDCSQGKRNYPGDEEFVCRIGNQNECKIAQNINHPRTSKVNPNIAKLGHVGLYARRHDQYQGTYPALNISVVLPNSDERALNVAMIMVNFSSQSGAHKDEFYHNNPRCRLFDFSPSRLTKVDLQHPREISYPCLVGLSTDFPKHYTIKLSDVPFATVTNYYITTYSYVHRETCITASAISVLQPTNNIHVVFDGLSGGVHTVRLYYTKNGSVIQSFNIADNQHEFTVHEPGEYRVGIEPFPFQTTCRELLTNLIFCPANQKMENVAIGITEKRSDILAVALLLGLAISIVIIYAISCSITLHRGRKRAVKSSNYIPLTTFNTSVNPVYLNSHQDQENTRVKTVDSDSWSDSDRAQGNDIDVANMEHFSDTSSGDHLTSYPGNNIMETFV
ncbi:uncharacterized protein LOC126820443 [Patella vulgata]|uniref:uncharacterized protein LOC126820443 n=1 Tax=Patella vulgata TaxID=6465 RepID=UPI0024A81D54|nr:uncharacterized protein LOC126820443 [Patella vulgata]